MKTARFSSFHPCRIFVCLLEIGPCFLLNLEILDFGRSLFFHTSISSNYHYAWFFRFQFEAFSSSGLRLSCRLLVTKNRFVLIHRLVLVSTSANKKTRKISSTLKFCLICSTQMSSDNGRSGILSVAQFTIRIWSVS